MHSGQIFKDCKNRLKKLISLNRLNLFLIFNAFYFVLVVDDFPEEVHDTNVESELKEEDETFEKTMEVSNVKSEQTETSYEPELKVEDETFEEDKEMDKFKAEQVEQAEYEADLEAELKSYANLEEKLW